MILYPELGGMALRREKLNDSSCDNNEEDTVLVGGHAVKADREGVLRGRYILTQRGIAKPPSARAEGG